MASLLEEFFIKFTSDMSSVSDGAKEASDRTDDLKEKLVETDRAASRVGRRFNELGRNAKSTFLQIAALGGVAGIGAAIIGQARELTNLDLFSKSLGENVEQISAWSEAAKRFGGSTQGVLSSIQSLRTGLGGLAAGAGDTGLLTTLGLLGVNPFTGSGTEIRDIEDILLDVSRAFQNPRFNRGAQVALGAQLGLDPGLVRLLQQGPEAVSAALKSAEEIGVANKEEAERTKRLNESFRDLSQSINNLVRVLAESGLIDNLAALVNFLSKGIATPEEAARDVGKALEEGAQSTFDRLKEFFKESQGTSFFDYFDFTVPSGKEQASLMSILPSQSIRNINRTNRNNSISISGINVDARGGNSREIARNLTKTLEDQMNSVLAEYQDGILA